MFVFFLILAMAIINFCSVIQSYAKYENVIGTQKLAKIKNCPKWIIECRHALCHLSPTPPTSQLLSNGVSFCFKWMTENFFQKMIKDQAIIDNEVSWNISCYTSHILLNDSLSPRVQLKLTNPIYNYMKNNPNSYIDIFANILLTKLPSSWCPKFEKNFDNRASIFFKVIFSFNPGHNLILLLNCLADKLIDLQNNVTVPAFSTVKISESIYFGHIWMRKILINSFYLNEEKLRDSFHLLPNKIRLKSEFQFQWKRLFYKLLKIEPNQFLIDSINVIRFFIEEIENVSMIDQIIKVMEIYINKSSLVLTNIDNNGDSAIKEIKEVKIQPSGIYIINFIYIYFNLLLLINSFRSNLVSNCYWCRYRILMF